MGYEIPTKTITIDDRSVEVYLWLTQDQEDEINRLLLGEQEIDVSKGDDDITIMVNVNKSADLRKLIVTSLCKDLTWEDYSKSSPDFRNKLYAELDGIKSGKKK